MHRREWLSQSLPRSLVAGLAFIGTSGCRPIMNWLEASAMKSLGDGPLEVPRKPVAQPPFDPQILVSKLDQLAKAFEKKGMTSQRMLQPPLRSEQLQQQITWAEAPLPPELLTLYGWRGGAKLAGPGHPGFLFRDMHFAEPSMAQQHHLMQIQALEALSQHPNMGPWAKDALDLERQFYPFAVFESAAWVLPLQKGPFRPGLERPVISTFQACSVLFYSMTTMVSTCIDWVSDDRYDPMAAVPLARKVELDIWEYHNPGIFDQIRTS